MCQGDKMAQPVICLKMHMPGANNEYWRQEEFDTVGIDHIRDDGSYADAANWYFTENTIRREQGFYWRAKYA